MWRIPGAIGRSFAGWTDHHRKLGLHRQLCSLPTSGVQLATTHDGGWRVPQVLVPPGNSGLRIG